MIIDEKLFSILTSSPAPIPAIATKVFLMQAAQRTAYPYLVYQVISKTPLTTLDGTENFRTWHYQFKCYAQTALETHTILATLSRFLTSYTDRPGAGIEAVIELGMRDTDFVEADRGFGAVLECSVMERLA